MNLEHQVKYKFPKLENLFQERRDKPNCKYTRNCTSTSIRVILKTAEEEQNTEHLTLILLLLLLPKMKQQKSAFIQDDNINFWQRNEDSEDNQELTRLLVDVGSQTREVATSTRQDASAKKTYSSARAQPPSI